VAHACNLSYSGGRDQGDRGSKPAWVNSSRDNVLKKPFTKKGLVEWLKVKGLSTGKKKKRVVTAAWGIAVKVTSNSNSIVTGE
jgi:hypothetical protein